MSDTSRSDTSRLISRVSVFGEKGMEKLAATMQTCHMYIKCHVCAPFVYRNGFLVNLLA